MFGGRPHDEIPVPRSPVLRRPLQLPSPGSQTSTLILRTPQGITVANSLLGPWPLSTLSSCLRACVDSVTAACQATNIL